MSREFGVMVEGDHCLIDIDGRVNWYAFATTRVVAADDPESAMRAAVALVESELAGMVKNPPSDPPRVRAAEPRLLPPTYSGPRPIRGFTLAEEREDP